MCGEIQILTAFSFLHSLHLQSLAAAAATVDDDDDGFNEQEIFNFL
jgi:hypothetical protein